MQPVNFLAGRARRLGTFSRSIGLLRAALLGTLSLGLTQLTRVLPGAMKPGSPRSRAVRFILISLLVVFFLSAYPFARPGLAQQTSRPPDVLFLLGGSMNEGDWIGGGFGSLVTLQGFSYGSELSPSYSWNKHMTAIGRTIAPTGSYVTSSGKADGGVLDYQHYIYLDWVNPNSLDFGWPSLEVQESTKIYVRGLAGTPFQLHFQQNAVLTNNSLDSQFYNWSGSDDGVTQGYVGWNQPEPTNIDYPRTGTTRGDPVYYNGVAYTLATVIGAGGYLEQNGSYGGTHEGEIGATGRVTVKLLVKTPSASIHGPLVNGADVSQVPVGDVASFDDVGSHGGNFDPNGDVYDPDIADAEWKFTDPKGAVTSFSGDKVNYTPKIAGTYTVALTITDHEGQSDTATKTFTVPPPDIQIVSIDGSNPLRPLFNVKITGAFDKVEVEIMGPNLPAQKKSLGPAVEGKYSLNSTLDLSELYTRITENGFTGKYTVTLRGFYGPDGATREDKVVFDNTRRSTQNVMKSFPVSTGWPGDPSKSHNLSFKVKIRVYNWTWDKPYDPTKPYFDRVVTDATANITSNIPDGGFDIISEATCAVGIVSGTNLPDESRFKFQELSDEFNAPHLYYTGLFVLYEKSFKHFGRAKLSNYAFVVAGETSASGHIYTWKFLTPPEAPFAGMPYVLN